jgi:hypothetical protein
MELQVKEITFPQVIEFNYLELKKQIEEKVAVYAALSYSEDQIQEAKKDAAALRKFTKAMSDERIKIKKECLKPYEDFEAKIKELDGIVNKAIQNIDGQVKGFEEQKKAEKLEAIKELWNNGVDYQDKPEWLKFDQIFNEKWLNASVSMKAIDEEMFSRLSQIEEDLKTLSNLPEFSFEAIEEYKQSLDINKAITEGKRLVEIQKRKAEEQQKMNEAFEKMKTVAENMAEGIAKTVEAVTDAQSEKMWISFKALLSVEDAQALKSFFESRNIQFEAI